MSGSARLATSESRRGWNRYMAFNDIERKRTEKVVGAFVEKRRPPPHIRPELDLGFRVKDQCVEIFEIRQVWRDPGQKTEHGVAKASFVRTQRACFFAFPGQRGFVGGSMGDDAVILQGAVAETDDQRNALFSTVHGAGRVMSRTEAAGPRRGRRGKGKITREMQNEWLAKKGVILRGGGVDEAPQAYRRLADVLETQGDTIEVLHTLRPLVVVMAS